MRAIEISSFNGTIKLRYKGFISTIILKETGGGFTLIELMIVIAILGTIAGIGIPLYASYIDTARVTRAIAEIRILEKEIYLFYDENDVLPDTLNDIGREDLMDPWGNPYQYLNIVALDKGKGGSGGNGGNGGKGNKGSKGDKGNKGDKGDTSDKGGKGKPRKDRFLVPINSDYDLYSMGKDGQSVIPLTAKHSRDDIVRANDGEFIGLAYKY